MYGPKRIATFAVGSYPTFSPLPLRAVILCYIVYALADIKPLACVALCVARTFLPLPKQAAMKRIRTAKVIKKTDARTRLRVIPPDYLPRPTKRALFSIRTVPVQLPEKVCCTGQAPSSSSNPKV